MCALPGEGGAAEQSACVDAAIRRGEVMLLDSTQYTVAHSQAVVYSCRERDACAQVRAEIDIGYPIRFTIRYLGHSS